MSFLFKRALSFPSAEQIVGGRTGSRTRSIVTNETSLRHSAVWACRRLRADLVSTMPVGVFRTKDGVDLPMVKPAFFTNPDEGIEWPEWAYSSQDDLDAAGNTVGIIKAFDGTGKPAQIELVPQNVVSARGHGAQISEWRIAGERIDAKYVWHEKQFTRSGMPMGLSPIAYAAMSIGGYLSAQEFARDWFAGGGIPAARLKNTAKTIDPTEARAVKDRFRETVGTGDLFVHGMDWEYDTIQAKASETAFIEQMQFSISDLCRFMGVPGDMIDAESSSGTITYANITQRNLQFLIMNLNPVLRRREVAFSNRLLPQPRFVKFNRAGLLEMDLKSRYEAHKIGIDARFLAPSEVRSVEDLPPFTPEELAEFGIFSKAPAAASPLGGQA